MKKYVVPILLALFWLFVSSRIELLPIAILLLSFPFAPYAKKKYIWAVCTFCVVSLYPLSPIAITYKNVTGSPKIVGHCNIRLEGSVDTAIKKQSNGDCIIASDIVSGFEPKWFIVW